MKFNFNNTYINLPENFYSKVLPVPVKNPKVVLFNRDLARGLGLLENISDREIAQYFSGNKIPIGAEPIALVYAGHQFGHFVPRLGDGRAVLLGEIVNPSGERYDLQLKGSGQTPYSRLGDGRAALGPMLREYIVSESMYHLGIKTTRSLAVVKTGETVFRNEELPGAVLARIAQSHIRVGTFEYFAAKQDFASIKILTDYAITRHFPDLSKSSEPYLSFLMEVAKGQAELTSDWMAVGFIHGVMNTDNMSIASETIDFGPCAFLDEYIPNKTFSSIDYHGRYAFNNQPSIALWNLICLYNCLTFLLTKNVENLKIIIKDLEKNFTENFNEKYLRKMWQKIGIFAGEEKENLELLEELLNIMFAHQLDYTLTFRHLSYINHSEKLSSVEFFKDVMPMKDWLIKWRAQLQKQKLSATEISKKMQNINPAFIPRNHRIEEAIRAATFDDDFSKAKNLITVLTNPYQENQQLEYLMNAPSEHEKIRQTFCGT